MRDIISPISVISQMGKTPYQLWTEYRTALCVHVMMMAEELQNMDMVIIIHPHQLAEQINLIWFYQVLKIQVELAAVSRLATKTKLHQMN